MNKQEAIEKLTIKRDEALKFMTELYRPEDTGYLANRVRVSTYNIAINTLEQIDEQQADIIDEPVKSEQTLKEQLQQKQKDSHRIWFERWYRATHLEHELMVSASQNYKSYSISISDNYDLYLKRRLRDPKTIAMLKEEMPSIKIWYEKKERRDIFNRSYYVEEIIFDWSDKNG